MIVALGYAKQAHFALICDSNNGRSGGKSGKRQEPYLKLSHLKIHILPSAKDDIRKGHRFYQAQESDLGSYFTDSIYANIDSLAIYGGIHPKRNEHFRFCAKPFPIGSITE